MEGDLCDRGRAMAPAEGCGDEVRYVGVAPGLGLEEGVAIFRALHDCPLQQIRNGDSELRVSQKRHVEVYSRLSYDKVKVL